MEKLIDAIKYQRIIDWNHEKIVLENGMELTLDETMADCCASASGTWGQVELDAIITNIEIEVTRYQEEIYDTGECESTATVTIFNNQNEVCARGFASADDGNCGYYYSVCSLVVKLNEKVIEQVKVVDC